MNEHRLYHSANFITRTIARRRRAHAARQRMARMRARMAAVHAATMHDLESPEHISNQS